MMKLSRLHLNAEGVSCYWLGLLQHSASWQTDQLQARKGVRSIVPLPADAKGAHLLLGVVHTASSAAHG